MVIFCADWARTDGAAMAASVAAPAVCKNSRRVKGVFMELSRPAVAVGAFDELGRLGRVLRDHARAVPFEFLADAQRDAAEQHDFREIRGDGEARVAVLGLVVLDGLDPFEVML